MVLQQRINTIEHTFVTSEKKYRDFILELDLKDDPGFNSGILLRCEDAPAAAATRLNGYQVKIDNSKRSSTGGIFDNFGDSWRWLFDLKDDANARAAFDLGEWSHFRIKCIGSGWMDRSPVVASRLCGAGGFSFLDLASQAIGCRRVATENTSQCSVEEKLETAICRIAQAVLRSGE